jgi:class 3 adenylate cyclase/tetratricopeptide (TPR) repeat protein
VSLSTYLPQDRLRALARGDTLPDRTAGSALFADISGFTALTEALRDSLGPRRGAEEISGQLDAVYTALIAEVEKYGGSVIGFAGDAITCWFDDSDGPASPRAVTCAFALQTSIVPFSAIVLPNGAIMPLALRVGVATGAARRFMVGDPAIHYIDTLAGDTVARTSTAKNQAQQGEVLSDEATVGALGKSLTINEWRTDAESGERFAVLHKSDWQSDWGSYWRPELRSDWQFDLQPAMPADLRAPAADALQAWVHRAVYEREKSGPDTFLTEFRPCVAVFVSFSGIDYDSAEAQTELDAFVRRAQGIAAAYDGMLLDLTIGDKGSYAYVNFGALAAHEDDARRAVKMALDLREASSLSLQIGITQGVMRVGAYGGGTRRVYGALGGDVNLAARLMTTASAGETLLSGHVHKAVMGQFTFEPRSPLLIEGIAEPLPVFAVTGERQGRAIRLQEPAYPLPMVGRTEELQLISDKLDLALKARGQVIGIVAEAGMGKSRLVAEAIRLARKKGFAGYGGACQSDAVNTPYQAWKTIWAAFFGVDPSMPMREQIRSLENEIADRAPERAQALPLLGILLNLEIPDSEFTKGLEPRYRQSALRALLEDCLRAAAKDEPLLIVIEDLHWIDGLSQDLLVELARGLSDSRACFMLAYRPPQLARLEAPRLEAMPDFTRIALHELNATEAERAIRAKLEQLYPGRGGAMPAGLVDQLMARAQGNPFYLEELLNYMHDRGLDPADVSQIELPDSLHTLILSRIDTLAESEKLTLRVASIIGRLFRAGWLTGYYPDLGTPARVKNDLDQLARMDITPLDSPEPELTYLFKHIVTHEVTYESLPFGTRARLHDQLAAYLEGIAAPLDTIAHHYGQSQNTEKQREYWQKAGDAAYEEFANEAALDYYARLLPLLADPQERVDLYLNCARATYALGRLAEARGAIEQALDGLGRSLPTFGNGLVVDLLGEIGQQVWRRVRFGRRLVTEDAPDLSPAGAEQLKLARAYLLLGFVDVLADNASIVDLYTGIRALNLTETVGRRSPELALAYSSVAYTFGLLRLHRLARDYFRLADATLAGLEELPVVVAVLSSADSYALCTGAWTEAERGCARALELSERLGDHHNWRVNHFLLGYVAGFQGQFARSEKVLAVSYQKSLADRHLQHQTFALSAQAWNALQWGHTADAIALAESATPIFAQIADSHLAETVIQAVLASAYLRQGQFNEARQAATTASELLAPVSLPHFSALVAYGHIADVYLSLWEREKAQKTGAGAELKNLARVACKSLHRCARLFPVAQPRAWLWQGVYNWLEGRPIRARLAWQKSLSAAQRLGMPLDEALAFFEIGRHAASDEQAGNLTRANDIFDRLGVPVAGRPSARLEQ